MQHSGSVALITGASRGLGFAVAKEYARHGMSLVISARDGTALAAAARTLGHAPHVVALAGDVADRAHAERLVSEAVRTFGGLDVLVNNASELGPSPLSPLADLGTAEYERILSVNAVAPLRLTQLALPYLTARRGVVINVSSNAGVNAYAGWGGYGSSKAALEHWSRVLAEEIKESGVRIFVVDPGDMDTHMHRLAEPGVDLSHLPKAEHVAPAFLQMLSDARPFARFAAQKLIEPAGVAS